MVAQRHVSERRPEGEEEFPESGEATSGGPAYSPHRACSSIPPIPIAHHRDRSSVGCPHGQCESDDTTGALENMATQRIRDAGEDARLKLINLLLGKQRSPTQGVGVEDAMADITVRYLNLVNPRRLAKSLQARALRQPLQNGLVEPRAAPGRGQDRRGFRGAQRTKAYEHLLALGLPVALQASVPDAHHPPRGHRGACAPAVAAQHREGVRMSRLVQRINVRVAERSPSGPLGPVQGADLTTRHHYRQPRKL
mmetsp:Transcript_28545/g.94727  ORF Transcript_28545/g.94727 Transcript_28545/m.94727 type:complete len:253 (-) Transcript_28545:37-795(-)